MASSSIHRMGSFACGLALAAAAALSLCGLASAQAPADADAAEFQAKAEALARANSAVVGVLSEAVDEAGSIATLGRLRHGSGVVIDNDGLVLTIGYLILEADHVDLIVEGERIVPARVVA